MPPSAAAWTIEARQAALVHELTHIKRADRRTQAIAQLACAIYWFNPLVWYAAAGLARERERACDDEVLRFGAKPSAYATLLLDLARKPGSCGHRRPRSAWRGRSAIEGRLLSILADAVRVPRRSTRWLVGFSIVAITTTILGAQAAQPSALQQPMTADPPAAAEAADPAAAADGARRQDRRTNRSRPRSCRRSAIAIAASANKRRWAWRSHRAAT